MSNVNLATTIVRLSFAKGNDEIYVGKTKNNNFTFVGEIVYSEDLTISHYNKLFDVDGSTCVGSVGTICIADNEKTNALIEQVESIQAARPVNARGNKYPFVFLRVLTNGAIIFNKGVNGEKHRLTFLDVELIEVEGDAPDEVVRVESPQLTRNLSNYGTVRYRRPKLNGKSVLAQTNVALDSAAIANSASVGVANISNSINAETPSFNTNIISKPQASAPVKAKSSLHAPLLSPTGVAQENATLEEAEKHNVISQQDKLNMISVAMKTAGMSGSEIAEALKAELELVF